MRFKQSNYKPFQQRHTLPSNATLAFDTKNLHISTLWILQGSKREKCPCSWCQRNGEPHVANKQFSQSYSYAWSYPRQWKCSMRDTGPIQSQAWPFGRSIHNNKRQAQGVIQPHSHYMFIDMSHFNNKQLQSGGNSQSYPPEKDAITQWTISSCINHWWSHHCQISSSQIHPH